MALRSSPQQIFSEAESDALSVASGLDTTPPPSEGGKSSHSNSGSLQLGKQFMACVVCEQRCKKSHAKWGACCRTDVDAVAADAERQGDEQLQVWYEANNTDFGLRTAVLSYKLSCPSRGQGQRRGPSVTN